MKLPRLSYMRVSIVPADLKEGGKELPTNMLQLMGQLDKQGPHFANKLLITLISECQLWVLTLWLLNMCKR